MNAKYLFIIILLVGCQQDITLVSVSLPKAVLDKDIRYKELVDYVNANMYYMRSDNSFLTSFSFQSTLKYYRPQIQQLSFEEAKQLFGKSSCETDKQACYYLHIEPVKGKTLKDYRLFKLDKNGHTVIATKNPVIVLNKVGNQTKMDQHCECDK